MGTSFDTPRAILEALWGHDVQIAQAALARLYEIVSRCSHPRVKRAGRDSTQLWDLVYEYCQSLLSSEARAAKASILTMTGLTRDVHSYFSTADAGHRSVDSGRKHYYAALFRKTSKLLRGDDDFARVASRGARRYVMASRQLARRGLPAQAIRDRLPHITSILTWTREDQAPPLVSREDLKAQLVRIFDLAGNVPRLVAELAQSVYDSLEPQPPENFAVPVADEDAETAVGASPEEMSSTPEDHWASSEIAAAARTFLSNLPPRTRTVVKRYYAESRTLDEIAAELDVSKSTIGNEVGASGFFGKELEKAASSLGYDYEATREFLQCVLELSAGRQSSANEHAA